MTDDDRAEIDTTVRAARGWFNNSCDHKAGRDEQLGYLRLAVGCLCTALEKLSAPPEPATPKEQEWQVGDSATCEMCGEPITYVGPYWKHVNSTPRHPAIPQKDSPQPPADVGAAVAEKMVRSAGANVAGIWDEQCGGFIAYFATGSPFDRDNVCQVIAAAVNAAVAGERERFVKHLKQRDDDINQGVDSNVANHNLAVRIRSAAKGEPTKGATDERR